MHNMKDLFKIQLLEIPLLIEFKTTNWQRKLFIIAVLLGVFLFAVLMSLEMVSISVLLITLDLGAYIPAFTISMTSVLIFFFVLWRAKNMLFAANDWGLLASLPIPTWKIVFSKTLFFYLILLNITCVLSLPPIIIWFYFLPEITTSAFILSLIVLLSVPLIPLFFGTLLTLLISRMTQRLKNSAIISGLVTAAIIIALGLLINALYLNDGVITINQDGIKMVVENLIEIRKYYLPSLLLDQQFNTPIYFGYILFIIISIIFFTILIAFITKYYQQINTYLRTNISIKKQMKKMKQQTPLKALVTRELAYFFQSPTAIMSLGFGHILIIILSIVLIFFDSDNFINQMTTTKPQFIAYLIGVILIVSNYTPAILSLEGKQLWITQTLPLSFKTIITAKVLANLILQNIPLALFSLALLVKSSVPWPQIVLSIIWMFSFSLFISLFGLLINFFFPKYDWRHAKEPIQQGISLWLAFVSSLIILFLLALFGVSFTMMLEAKINGLLIMQIVLLNSTSFLIFHLLKQKQLYEK